MTSLQTGRAYPINSLRSRLTFDGRGNPGTQRFPLIPMSSRGVRVITDVTAGSKESSLAGRGLGGLLDGIPVRTMQLMKGDRGMQRTRVGELHRATTPFTAVIAFTIQACGYADSASVVEGADVT